MLKNFISMYKLKFPKTLVLLLQEADYKTKDYRKVINKTKNFNHVKIKDRKLTKKSKSLLYTIYTGIFIELLVGIFLIVQGINNSISGGIFFGIALIIIYPIIWAYIITIFVKPFSIPK